VVHQLLPRGHVGPSSAEILPWYTLDGSGFESLVSCEVDGARCEIYLHVNEFIMIFLTVTPIVIGEFKNIIVKG
jgi:hypothetical protein